MKKIKLTRGMSALVDDEDFEYLNQWKWYAVPMRNTYYAQRRLSKKEKQKVISMHRVIMNTEDNMQVDHIDHDGLNNQKHNLRNCVPRQNQMNMKPRGRVKYIGVSYNNKGFIRARIRIYGRDVHLGYFKTEEDAAIARDKASIKYFGEFAYLNFG